MIRRWIKIDWSGPWTWAWPGYFNDVINGCMADYKQAITESIYAPNPLYELWAKRTDYKGKGPLPPW